MTGSFQKRVLLLDDDENDDDSYQVKDMDNGKGKKGDERVLRF